MKQLTVVLLLLTALLSCGGEKAPTASDFSGKLFNAAFPETSPMLNGINAQNRKKLAIQYVFNVDGTGAMRISMNNQLQNLTYSWQVEDASLILKFANGQDKYTIKRAGGGYELESSRSKLFLFKNS